MAKVKIQIDLTKKRPPHVWVGLDKEDVNMGRWQAIEYESIPNYCMYCKYQGHLIHVCNTKQRDDDFKKRKEQETEKQTKKKAEQGKSDHKGVQMQETNREADVTNNHTNGQSSQHTGNNNTDEQWQVQKRKNSRNDINNRDIPHSPPRHNEQEKHQQSNTAASKNNIPIHNNYINLDVQGQENNQEGAEHQKQNNIPTLEQQKIQESHVEISNSKLQDSPNKNNHRMQ